MCEPFARCCHASPLKSINFKSKVQIFSLGRIYIRLSITSILLLKLLTIVYYTCTTQLDTQIAVYSEEAKRGFSWGMNRTKRRIRETLAIDTDNCCCKKSLSFFCNFHEYTYCTGWRALSFEFIVPYLNKHITTGSAT